MRALLLLSTLAVSFLHVSVGQDDSITLKGENPTCGDRAPVSVCKMVPDKISNAIFILDGSGSVAEADFALQKNFVANLTPDLHLDPGNDGNHAAVIHFSDQAKVMVPFTGSSQEFESKTKLIQQETGKTYITKSLELAEQTFRNYDADMPDRAAIATKRIFLFTDGTPTGEDGSELPADIDVAKNATKDMALQLRSAPPVGLSIVLTTIAVGVKADNETLQKMASVEVLPDGAEKVLFKFASNFAALVDLRDDLVVKTVERCDIKKEPPYFCGFTPNNGQFLPACASGSEVSFVVSVADPETDNAVEIDFLTGTVDGNEYSMPAYADITGNQAIDVERANMVYRVFSWLPNKDEKSTPICFQGRESDTSERLSTGIRCVTIQVSYPPQFLEPCPSSGDQECDAGFNWENDCAVVNALVNEKLSFSVTADDNNAGDDVTIFSAGQLPPNAELKSNVCTGDDNKCNPVTRDFSWTPSDGDVGLTFTLDFRARDDQHVCEAGGYYSDAYCVKINVVSPVLAWDEPPTPAGGNADASDASVLTSYMHCPLEIHLQASYEDYDVAISNTGAMPAGMAWAGETSAIVGQDHTAARVAAWKPARGQEGRQYVIHFHASDLSALTTIHKFVKVNVVRCKYCVTNEDSMLSIAANFNLNWLQLWGVNVNVQNPDHLYKHQLINLCPVYYARDGDTLDNLAERYGTTPEHIVSMNPDIVNADTINQGQELCVCPGICNELYDYTQ